MKIKQYQIIKANSFYKRLLGFMFIKNADYGLYFPNCHAIHTFFMCFNLDVILIKNNKIIAIKRNIKPWKIIIFKDKKTGIIELPHNSNLIITNNDLIIN